MIGRQRIQVWEVKVKAREKNQTILVVDDEQIIRNLLERTLSMEGYPVLQARDGKEALEQVARAVPDLILLDLRMPGMDGLEVLRQLRDNPRTRLTPVIVLTAYEQEKVQAFQTGANDFLAKPFEREELLARILAHLRLQQAIQDLEDAESVLVFIARVVEAKDAYTEHHIERVAHTAHALGRQMGLDQKGLETLRRGALLHDIGKIGIKEAILNKPGPLTQEERAEMERHVLIGEDACRPLRTLEGVLPIIRHHHERWDGTGYPDRLAGEAIPLLARIVAVADVLDALTSQRPYRDAWPESEAYAYIEEQAGTQFDPVVVEALMKGGPHPKG